jgi:putative two-component system response regulator
MGALGERAQNGASLVIDADARVLIVDDSTVNVNILIHALKGTYRLGVARSGLVALEYVNKHLPDLVLLDIMMPGMDGYEVCARLKDREETRDIPVIFITAMNDTHDKAKGFEMGAVDYITKPFEVVEVRARVKTHLALRRSNELLKDQSRRLEEKVRERTRDLRETQLEILNRLGRAAEYRDNETGLHIQRIGHYCARLARALGLDEDQCELLQNASRMHDIGKIGIPDGILLKPGKLEPKEWEIMKTHPGIGAEILSGNGSKLVTTAREIALTHHEKWDGSGYPAGLKGEEIPLSGRIVCVCDVFDALISRRPYKEPWPLDKAVAEIRRGSGAQFDPALVEVFLRALPELVEVAEQFADVE